MVDQAQVIREIEQVLATETRATLLSNKLFTPNGLFSRLASTEAERRALVKTPLFEQALDRLDELESRAAGISTSQVRERDG